MKENVDIKKNTRRGIKAIWRHLQPFRKQLAVLGVLGTISSISNGFVPYVTGHFFDALIGVSEHKAPTGVAGSWPIWATFLVAWFVVQVVANNTDWIMDRLRRRVDTGIHFKIQTDGFTHMFRLPMSFHKNSQSNAEMQKISQAGWRVSSIVGTLSNIVPQFLGILIGIILAATISPMLAGVLMAGVVIYILLLLRILRPVAAIDTAAHKSWNESWEDAASSVQQIESVKQSVAEDYEEKKVRDNLGVTTFGLWLKLENNWSNVNFFQRMIVFLTQLTVFILAVRLIANGSITVGQLVALNGYALMFFGPVAALGNSWQVIQNGITSAAATEETFEKEEEVYVPADAFAPTALSGDVYFDHVSFAYAPGQPDVLMDLDYHAAPGQSIALVGESGVGKSTSIALISGYYFPSKGAVKIDGVDTRKFDLGALRRSIAVVPQEVALFNDTIRANIKYGSFGATDEEVLAAAKAAHIDDFVSTFPKGYETVVGERGVKLSVGQKQRVAIARAMLRKPAILVLDEPTSALDAQTEKIVTTALEKLMTGRTTFIIAHRLSTVRKADKILVFEKGRIIEQGTHAELVKKEGGSYRRLYEYQIGLH